MFCLPKDKKAVFLAAIKSGALNPVELAKLESIDRRAALAKIVGDENAHGLNAALESKILLKDQQRGFVTWAKQAAGLSEAKKADIVDQAGKLERFLGPEEEKKFLADAAAKSTGAPEVTREEVKGIVEHARAAEAARQAMIDARKGQPVTEFGDRGAVRDAEVLAGNKYQDLIEYVASLKPHYQSLTERLADWSNVPKSLQTQILHLSAPGVQLWGMMSTRAGILAAKNEFSFFAKEQNYRDFTSWMLMHPDYALAKSSGLAITNLGAKLSEREEAIMSTLLERANTKISSMTGLPNVVRASNRAFSGSLNFARFTRFTELLASARLLGQDVSKGSKNLESLAAAVNDFTGRGSLRVGGLGLDDQTANFLNAIFYAPRKISATMRMFSPGRYLDPRVSSVAKYAAARQLLGSLAGTGAILGLASAAGAVVNLDWRSQDFAKIQIGNTTLDITGSNATYVRLLGRLASGQEITRDGTLKQLGQGYKSDTRMDLITGREGFLRGRMAPIAAAITDALYGSDMAGAPFSVTNEIRDRMSPIPMQSVLEVMNNDPGNLAGLVASLSSFVGVGVSVKAKKSSAGAASGGNMPAIR